MWKITSLFRLEKCLILWISPLFLVSKKCASHFCRETANEKKQSKESKTWISNSHLIRQSFYGYRCKSGMEAEGHLKLRLQFLKSLPYYHTHQEPAILFFNCFNYILDWYTTRLYYIRTVGDFKNIWFLLYVLFVMFYAQKKSKPVFLYLISQCDLNPQLLYEPLLLLLNPLNCI